MAAITQSLSEKRKNRRFGGTQFPGSSRGKAPQVTATAQQAIVESQRRKVEPHVIDKRSVLMVGDSIIAGVLKNELGGAVRVECDPAFLPSQGDYVWGRDARVILLDGSFVPDKIFLQEKQRVSL